MNEALKLIRELEYLWWKFFSKEKELKRIPYDKMEELLRGNVKSIFWERFEPLLEIELTLYEKSPQNIGVEKCMTSDYYPEENYFKVYIHPADILKAVLTLSSNPIKSYFSVDFIVSRLGIGYGGAELYYHFPLFRHLIPIANVEDMVSLIFSDDFDEYFSAMIEYLSIPEALEELEEMKEMKFEEKEDEVTRHFPIIKLLEGAGEELTKIMKKYNLPPLLIQDLFNIVLNWRAFSILYRELRERFEASGVDERVYESLSSLRKITEKVIRTGLCVKRTLTLLK